MTCAEAVTLLIERFPILRERVDDPMDLFETPHVTYSLLAAEALENVHDRALIKDLCSFIDYLTNSGDELLEEFLVVDVLEGIAQDIDLATSIRLGVSPRAVKLLNKVEREFFGRNR